VEKAQVPADVIAKEREIATAQVAEDRQDRDMAAKIVEGKVNKAISAITLAGQAFVKGDGKQTVENMLKSQDARVNGFDTTSSAKASRKGRMISPPRLLRWLRCKLWTGRTGARALAVEPRLPLMSIPNESARCRQRRSLSLRAVAVTEPAYRRILLKLRVRR
jgi:hypothetical protein